MKVAIVGLGYWGSKLLRNLVRHMPAANVVAVDCIDVLAAVYDEHPAITLASSIEEALADEEVRAVLIATPVETHAALAGQALRAGRHVFVEKPLASSVTDALELVHLAEDRQVRLMVGHTFLFSPRVQRIAEHLGSGEAGAIHYITSSRLNLGLHRNDVNVIWDLAPHDFSIIFHLLGELPLSAHTTAKSVVRPGCPDVAFITLAFPSGTIASVSVSWLAPRKVRSTVLVGERQMVVYDDTNPEEPIKIYDKGVVGVENASFAANQLTYRYGDTLSPYVAVDEPLSREISYFLGCLNGDPALSDGWFGLDVVRVLEAADLSWREGMTIEIAPTEIDLAERAPTADRQPLVREHW